jgi:hypothetical protein
MIDWWNPSLLDVNSDGAADYAFHGETLCTMSIPPSCTTTFGVSCGGSNELLVSGDEAFVVEPGTLIGPAAPTNAAWGGALAWLTSFRNGAGGYVPWTGSLGWLGEGYLGIRLPLADGEHYGWIRVRLPGNRLFPVVTDEGGVILAAEATPVIEDWAFEPQAGAPVLAGAKPYPAPVQPLGLGRRGYLRARVTTQPGWSYAVQHRATLGEAAWDDFGYIFIAPLTEAVLDLPVTGTQGFFRVVEAE